MIPIYICEDNLKILKHEEEIIKNHIMMQDYDFEIVIATDNPHKLIEKLHKSDQRGIYFLDIDLSSDMNGFDLGVEIRKHDTRGFITYITTHDEMMIETFKLRLEVMDYIVKDDVEQLKVRIQETLDHIYKYLKDYETIETDYFPINTFGTIRYIDSSDIIFFETSSKKHVVVCHLENEIIEFSGSLQAVENEVSDKFVRTHRSYIVNKDKIVKFDSKELILFLDAHKQAHVSRSMRKTLKEIL